MKLASASLLLLLTSLAAHGADITIEKTPAGGAIIKAGGQFFTEFVVDQANKTYLWPINGPTGTVMTRLYPMQKVEGEQHDHPHHRGLCFGHENIGGYDTWAERSTFGEKPSGKTSDRVSHLGAIKHREITEMKNGETGVLVTKADYVDAAGKKIIEEERKMTFRADADTRTIDVDIILIASEGDVVVDDKKDSGLSIRVPSEMAVEREKGKKGTGHIISSEGLKDADAWGKRAKWVDYYGTVKGDAVG
ncbi:MAG TPA: PmoA family protein, partial [Prosthecobacter sp.]|nr:PmoA family protein [Prosthecobacter sp.]